MTNSQKITLFLLRVSLGWMFLYSGLSKVLAPSWSAEGYIKNAKTFVSFYQWLTDPNILPIINFLNEWGQTALGIALILGIFVRISSILGALMMFLYYFPILEFPYVGTHSFLVDEHIIYAFTLIYLSAVRAGRAYGLAVFTSKLPFSKIRNWVE